MSQSSVKAPEMRKGFRTERCSVTRPGLDSPGDTERIRNGPSTSNGSPSVVSSLVVGRTRTRAERKTEEKAGSLDPTLSLNGLSTATADIPSHTLTRLRRTPNDCFTLRPAQPGDTTPAIHRLPLELLIQVFRIVIEVDKSTGWLSQDRVVKLSLVCRSWRSVVCNTPALWSSVSSNYKLARLKRVVELSKDHFMDVHWVADPLGTSTTNIRLLPAMIPLDRWRSLQANISTRNLALLSRNAAPNLEELDLALGESHNGRRLGLHTFNTIRLFQNSLPKLRHLKLQWSAQYLAFKWDSMVLPSLETFHITTANHSAVPSSTQLMGFLGRSPRIREVQLNLPTKSESAQQTDSQQPPHVVHLSSLQRFHLMSNASYASQVLSKLAAPPSAVMDLTVTLDVAEPYPTTLIQQVSPQLVHAAFLTSTISHGSKHAKADLLLDHQSIALQVSPRTPQNKITGSSKKDGVVRPLFHLRIFGTVERAVDGLATVLSTTTAIDPAITLNVIFDKVVHSDATTLLKAISRVPRVTEVHIGSTPDSTSGTVDRFLEFVSQPSVEPGKLVWPFPELERLMLCDADPKLIAKAIRSRYRGVVGGRRVAQARNRDRVVVKIETKPSELKPLKSLTAFWSNRVAGEYESFRDPVVKVLGVNRVLWWYNSGMKGVWQ